MTIESWNTFFQWGAVALVALTFVFVAGALWTSNRLNESQSTRLMQLESEIVKLQNALRDQDQTVNAAGPVRDADRARPRTLDASARARLLESLSRVQPEGPLAIRFVSASTTEPADFARALANVIEEAGWSLAEDSDSQPAFGTPPVGLLVRIPERGSAPPRALVLQDALNKAGIEARVERVATVGNSGVELMVGLRP